MDNNLSHFHDYRIGSYLDLDFMEKYQLLSAMWVKLAQLGRCKIHLEKGEFFFRVFSDEQGRDDAIRSFMELNIYVFEK